MFFSDFVPLDSRTLETGIKFNFRRFVLVVMHSFSLSQRIHRTFYMYGFRKINFGSDYLTLQLRKMSVRFGRASNVMP